jgi:L-asparaginase
MLTYGAGNPPDQNSDLIDALTQARQAGTVIINMTQCYAGSVAQGTYAVGSILNQLGVISAGNRTLEDMVTDLYLNLDKYRSS